MAATRMAAISAGASEGIVAAFHSGAPAPFRVALGFADAVAWRHPVARPSLLTDIALGSADAVA